MPKTIVEGKLNQKLLEQVTMNEIRQDETQKIYKGLFVFGRNILSVGGHI
jgi:hypothetical protein